MKNIYLKFCQFCSNLIAPAANLWARIYVGYSIFFVSGLAKIDDMEGTVELFDPEEDGEFVISFLPESLPPEIPAYMATAAELVLPVLLIAGLLTRFSAAGLLIMTIVIQFFVPGFEDAQHYLWMIILAMLIGYGGNKASLDYWLLKDR